jgi:hypothetical protein
MGAENHGGKPALSVISAEGERQPGDADSLTGTDVQVRAEKERLSLVFARWIAAGCRKHKRGQRGVAELLFGMPEQHLSEMLHGERNIPTWVLPRLGEKCPKVLGVVIERADEAYGEHDDGPALPFERHVLDLTRELGDVAHTDPEDPERLDRELAELIEAAQRARRALRTKAPAK